jgi:lysophospholipase L1-like esterase
MIRQITITSLLWLLCSPETSAIFAQDPKGYVALGDSLAFGFTPLTPLGNLKNYHGYPEEVADAIKTKLVNASCFGESAQHFVKLDAPDLGCQAWRANHHLFASYKGTQMDYAVKYLKSHWKTELVTINIGVNDLLLFSQSAGAFCNGDIACITNKLISEFLPAYAANLTTIYNRIRIEAAYTGPIVAVNGYAIDYQNPVQVAGIAALNSVLASVFQGNVADAFTAFGSAAAAKGGDLCATGLLVKFPNGTCDTHPSAAGHALIADLILDQLN